MAARRKSAEKAKSDKNISNAKRNRLSRAIVGMTGIGLAYGLPTSAGILLGGLLGLEHFGGLLGSYGGLWLFYNVFPRLTVNVPRLQGIVTSNTFKNGRLVPYGPGLHFRLPWEDVEANDWVSLQDMTNTENVGIQSKGAKLNISFQFRWRPDVSRLDIYFTHGITTINNALSGLFKEFLSSQLALYEATDVLRGMRVLSMYAKMVFRLADKIDENSLSADELKFRDIIEQNLPDPARRAVAAEALLSRQEAFGIEMLDFEIIKVDFTLDVQKAKDAVEEARAIANGAMVILGINPDDADAQKRYHDWPDKTEKDKAILRAGIFAKQGGMTDENITVSGDAGAAIGAAALRLLGRGGGGKGKGKGQNPGKPNTGGKI
jgi:regulator of protease activity HflC (stomatin/prohibitin superfamily)